MLHDASFENHSELSIDVRKPVIQSLSEFNGGRYGARAQTSDCDLNALAVALSGWKATKEDETGM